MLRTDRWRYIEWRAWNGSALDAVWAPEGAFARELYDHAGDTGVWTDPNAFENVNLVETAPKATVAGLSATLRRAFSSGGA